MAKLLQKFDETIGDPPVIPPNPSTSSTEKLWKSVSTASKLGFWVSEDGTAENNIWITTDGRYLVTVSELENSRDIKEISIDDALEKLRLCLSDYAIRRLGIELHYGLFGIHPKLWQAVADGDVEAFNAVAKKFAAEQGNKPWKMSWTATNPLSET